MLVWLIEVYLAKARESIADVLAKHHAISLNVILECYLVPRSKADRDFRIVLYELPQLPERRELPIKRVV